MSNCLNILKVAQRSAWLVAQDQVNIPSQLLLITIYLQHEN